DGKRNAKAYELLEDYINNIRIDPYFINLSHNGLIGTGGNIEELAKIINSKQNNNDSMVVKLADLDNLVMLLKKMSIEERISEFNLREDRADVILPAAMMFIAMCKRLGNNEIIVPGAGVRDGIVVDLYSRHSGSDEHENLWHPHLYESVENLGGKFGIDFNHAKYVTRVASKLFDQMRNLLGLDQEDGKYLDTAAMLHDIGQHISYDRHHKHSLYILTNSELPGFDKLEMSIIANVARYHRRAEPKIEHANFASLSPADQNRVRRLSAILRLADAMDSEHLQRIDKFTVNIGENEIELLINSNPSYSENIKIAKKGQMLEAITGKNLVTRELNDEQ
ncbi:MAG: HD domain-containing protein, partial [Caldiserica bacterium]|nr:HD domain-containing protein [Caldisericota bacterium]